MTIVTRSITPKAAVKRYTLTNVVRTAQDSYYPIGMSADRTQFYARNAKNLYQSTDDGVTWVLINAFPFTVSAMCETKQGECLVQLDGNKIYRSTGWSINKATATWALVHTVIGDRIEANWNLKSENMGTNGVIVFAEYGAHTVTGGETENAGKARRILLSEDDGRTWRTIWDILTSTAHKYGKGMHPHGACYHEIDDRIYFTFGDGTGDAQLVAGSGKIFVAYSDDRGATWTFIPTPTDFFQGMQITTISAFDNNIVLLPDGLPYGICIIPRTGYRTLGQLRFVNQYTGSAPVQVIGQGLFKPQSGADRPLIALMNWFGTNSTRNRVMMSGDDGNTWNEAWRNTDAPQSNGGMSLYGPSVNNKIIGTESWSNGGQWANGARFSSTLTVVNA